MGWRDSYNTLSELFPQVDTRLIRGAALEHGNDVGAAAEFILNEVLGTDEGTSGSEQLPDTSTDHGSPNSFQALEQRSARVEEQAVTAADCGTSVDDSNRDEQVVLSVSSSESLQSSGLLSGSTALCITPEPEEQELTGEPPNESREGLLTTKEMGDRLQAEVVDAVAGGSTEPIEEDELGLADIVRQIFLLSRRKKDGQARPSDFITRRMSENQECILKSPESFGVVEYVTKSPAAPVDRNVVEPADSEVENSLEKSQVILCAPVTSNTPLAQEVNPAVSEDDETGEAGHIALGYENTSEFSAEESGPGAGLEGAQGLESDFDQYSSQMLERKERVIDLEEAAGSGLMPVGSHEEYTATNFTSDEFPVYDKSISVQRPAGEGDEVAPNDCLDSIMSIQESAISEEMDRADWENVNCISVIQMNQMEPLGNLVEVAKADKEALIISIEEIRVLRLMTDQAEYAARQSREEAARGGLEVMVKVDEMRKMLSRAREANAVHAGEVFGEKAVLATEARELQFRLAQVNREKAKAVAALNEIKTSLQARIENAVREKEAAEHEKIEKELRAKMALAKEETHLAKVAQESRDLDAEVEACTKIRDFLIERGCIVDALQGEVAVLREDAESLKKDLESMSLSFSGFHANMSLEGSDLYPNNVSMSGNFSESYGQPSESAIQMEGGGTANSNAGSLSLRTVSGVQKTASDRKSWSSLPSLLRGISGSQELNSSSHSGYSSNASNSLSASRDALDVNPAERSGSDNSMTDIKYLSSPYFPTSPEEKKQEERELLKAKMAMFPGEELEMEYLGNNNLDVFRSEKPIGSSGETDDEGWQMLEKVTSRSSSRSSGDK